MGGYISDAADRAAEYGDRYLKSTENYLKLKIFEQMALAVSAIAKIFLIGGLALIAFLLLALSGAWALGSWLGDIALGGLLVGIFFLVLALVVYALRDKINKRVIQGLSARFYD